VLVQVRPVADLDWKHYPSLSPGHDIGSPLKPVQHLLVRDAKHLTSRHVARNPKHTQPLLPNQQEPLGLDESRSGHAGSVFWHVVPHAAREPVVAPVRSVHSSSA